VSVGSDYRLLEDVITISYNFSTDLIQKGEFLPREFVSRLYYALKDKPERDIEYFKGVIFKIGYELAIPLSKEKFDQNQCLEQVEKYLSELVSSFYEAIAEEKFLIKYLFAWIDGIKLISEIWQVIKDQLKMPHFKKRKDLNMKQKYIIISQIVFYQLSLLFRIYEIERKISEGIICTEDDINRYLEYFSQEITALSKFAIRNEFIPKISSEEGEFLTDNAELMRRVFAAINER